MSRLLRLLSISLVLLLAGCDVSLFSGLTEREANDMIAVLQRADISASKTVDKEGVSIMVDEGSFGEAVEILNQHGLPQERFVGLGEVFKKDGLISSPTEERARFIFALGQELSHTLSEIDGVQTARVHVVVPENNSPLEKFKPSSASVFIRHQAGIDLNSLVSQIKTLVTNSIEGLVYDKVSVAFFASNSPVNGGTPQFAGSNAALPQANLVKVAGAWVHPSSAGTLRLMMWSLIAFVVIALIVCWIAVSSYRRSEKLLADHEAHYQ